MADQKIVEIDSQIVDDNSDQPKPNQQSQMKGGLEIPKIEDSDSGHSHALSNCGGCDEDSENNFA